MSSYSSTVDATQIRAAYNRNRAQMTLELARELNVPEVEIVRAMPEELSVELPRSRWEEIIRGFESVGRVHVILSNGVVTLEALGQFGNFSITGPYFNVQTPDLDMHIRYEDIGAIFAVKKPGHTNGVETLSVQFYGNDGTAAFKVFLNFGSPASVQRRKHFDEIVAGALINTPSA